VASAGGQSRSVYVTVLPASLTSVQLQTASIRGGDSTSGRIYLNGNNGKRISTAGLSSDNTAVTVDAAVDLSPEATHSHAFAVHTKGVTTTQTAHISASLNGVTKTTTLMVNP